MWNLTRTVVVYLGSIRTGRKKPCSNNDFVLSLAILLAFVLINVLWFGWIAPHVLRPASWPPWAKVSLALLVSTVMFIVANVVLRHIGFPRPPLPVNGHRMGPNDAWACPILEELGHSPARLDFLKLLEVIAPDGMAYLDEPERESLGRVLSRLASHEDRQAFYAAVVLWNLRGQVGAEDANTLVLTRDGSNCIKPESLVPNYDQLKHIKVTDWLNLPRMARRSYYTVIYRDLHVWSGGEGIDYFRGNAALAEQEGIDFRRLFYFPPDDAFGERLGDAETCVGEDRAKKILGLCIAGVSNADVFRTIWEKVKKKHPAGSGVDLQAVHDVASAYFDLALLVRVVKGHAKHGIPHMVADSTDAWEIPEKDDKDKVVRGRDPRDILIRNEGRPKKILQSCALIDDTAIIKVHTDKTPETDKTVGPPKEAPVTYEFLFEEEAKKEFRGVFTAIWHNHETEKASRFRTVKSVTKRNLAKLRSFVQTFSGLFASQFDKIGPMEKE